MTATILATLLLVALAPASALAEEANPAERAQSAAEASPLVSHVMLLLAPKSSVRSQSAAWIASHWDERVIPMLIEALRFMRDRPTRERVIELLQSRTGERHGGDLGEWQVWLWNREPFATNALGEFKAHLYRQIDPRFEAYFSSDRTARIRLDEVVWGGVEQDGIPALRSPKMIPATEAQYLADDHVVFAMSIDGEARAYPKRIMAWHEMFVDTVKGVPLVGVYCTLCGTMILYETKREGVTHELGTSGFLYRSNKLMYDRATQSLWNTLWGEPVIGPLAEQGFRLKRRAIVTTTWGEWRRRHPETLVLSRDTGHRRDYREGAAYRKYFATDRLMFQVPKLDTRLKNKAEVLALIFEASTATSPPLAIAADYLREHPLYHGKLGEVSFVIVTDASGANRVYQSGGEKFARWDGDNRLVDASGEPWTLSEDALRSAGGRQLARLPAHRAFWFGWYSAHPDTELIQ